MMKTSASLALTAALALACPVANATLIDFTDPSVWSVGGGSTTTRSADGIWVTVQAFDANGAAASYTNTSFDGNDASACRGLGCQSDGLGIADDEISFGNGAPGAIERIRVSFSEVVTIEAIFFLDLFAAVRNDSAAAEMAYVSTNGLDGDWAAWTGTATDQSGLFMATSDNVTAASSIGVLSNITTLDFFATDFGSFWAPANSDFALAGLQVRSTSVPEPSALALFGLALMGVALGRRKAARC